MAAIPATAYAVARETVERFAPSELVRFQAMWEDFGDDPDVSRPFGWTRPKDRPQAGGFEDTQHFLWTMIVIPVAVALTKDVVKKGIEVIVKRIWDLFAKKQPPLAVNEETVRKLAGVIQEVLEKHGNEPEAAKSAPKSDPTAGVP